MQVKNAKPKEKAYKLFDGGGLYLTIYPHGSKLWHMKHRQSNGKENVLSFGKYPDVSLERARQRREEARKLIADGIDPAAVKKAQKAAKLEQAANSFEVIAREWLNQRKEKLATNTAKHLIARLERDAFPYIGKKPIIDLTPADFLAILKRLESAGKLDTAHRIKGCCSQIMRYAIATQRAKTDPTSVLTGAIQPKIVTHRAAVTEPEQVAELLRMIDGYSGNFPCQMRTKNCPL